MAFAAWAAYGGTFPKEAEEEEVTQSLHYALMSVQVQIIRRMVWVWRYGQSLAASDADRRIEVGDSEGPMFPGNLQSALSRLITLS